MLDSSEHPLTGWMTAQMPPLSRADAAHKLACSEPFLSLVINWKRSVSLKRAAAWSKVTGLPIDAFVMTEAAE